MLRKRGTGLFIGILLCLPLAAQAESSSDNAFSGKTMTGDWGGTRSELYADGVNVRGGFIDEAMGVVNGGPPCHEFDTLFLVC